MPVRLRQQFALLVLVILAFSFRRFLPVWLPWAMAGAMVLWMVGRAPTLSTIGFVWLLRGGGRAVGGAHRNPMMVIVVVVLACAAVGTVLGVGGGATAAPASGATGPSLATTNTSGADLAARVGYNAGWRGTTLVEAVAFSGIESTWGPAAVSPTGCLGLWQLCPTHSRDLDPQTNADDAHSKWAHCSGGSFDCDWTPYDKGHRNPAWSTDYAIAVKAVAALPGGGN